MANTRLRGPLFVGGAVYAVGTQLFPQGVAGVGINAAATVGSKRGSFVAVNGFSTAGTIRAESTIFAGGGFGMVQNNFKKIATGTYIGSGAATAAIVSTGLTTIHHVFLIRNWQSRTAGATVRAAYMPSPAKAQGTPGSFYPLVGFIPTGASANPQLGIGAAATFPWLAFGV